MRLSYFLRTQRTRLEYVLLLVSMLDVPSVRTYKLQAFEPDSVDDQ